MKELENKNYIAHYTNLDTALNYILPSNKLRFGTAGKVNDPYENKIDWLEDDPSTTLTLDCPDKLNKIRTLISNHIKLLCVTHFRDLEKHETGIENLYYAIPLMWAHYGNKHKGACLIFDKEELGKEIEKIPVEGKIIRKKVEYCSFLSTVGDGGGIAVDRALLTNMIGDTKLLYNEVNKNAYLETKFFRKTKCWEIENEYRWLLFSKTYNDVFVNYKNSLKAIILGDDFDLREIDKVRMYKPDAHGLYQLSCIYGKYQLDHFD
ncbi:DUF2971 domain-containing protein [Legionella pneumophila serogroup 1]